MMLSSWIDPPYSDRVHRAGIVRDYSRRGDLVCDPFSGGGNTAMSCISMGRRFIGVEIDPDTHAASMARISNGTTMDMFA